MMYNVLSKPYILYVSEIWVLRAQHQKRIETAQMRFLRSTLGVKVREKVGSEEI
jgi:hypothetical protein